MIIIMIAIIIIIIIIIIHNNNNNHNNNTGNRSNNDNSNAAHEIIKVVGRHLGENHITDTLANETNQFVKEQSSITSFQNIHAFP